jgi:hypothetical protein
LSAVTSKLIEARKPFRHHWNFGGRVLDDGSSGLCSSQ